ncbi:hypothetical protein [Methylophaga nitratireducenticrescens]|uniref:hypothetical protein n=1 Tax=Methylophaga nitratireducenticrescens TaxID=754476 RepID=UPI000CDC15D2|nr:hypothetical protein [Methylophaga nitratireducenticrescens]AUZ85779.1 hypothetical protein CDW43_14945 [Methylophaga nitratireducenticrescens]AUZ85835.1 hypothetical protein CDW43_15240 [Methylophaga nitratireducenticrescens]
MSELQIVYHFHPVTKVYLPTPEPEYLQLDPKEGKPLLPGWSTLTEPLETQENEVNVFIGNSWELQADFRGYIGYDSIGNEQRITDINIEPDSQWTLERPFIFAEAFIQKLAEITQAFQVAMSPITSTYTAEDIASFPTQEAEAMAWDANNSASTPLLDLIVANRPGIDKATLVSRVITNAATYKALSGTSIGKKQAFEDLIYALKTQHEDTQQPDVTQADFDAIIVDYS